MAERWEWVLPAGTTITARVDRAERVESVWVDRKLIRIYGITDRFTRCTLAIPRPPSALRANAYRTAAAPREAELAFDATSKKCSLELGGVVVEPSRRPAQRAPFRPPRDVRPALAVLTAVFVVPVCAALASHALESSRAEAGRSHARSAATWKVGSGDPEAPTRSAMSADGSITARYPASFVAVSNEDPSALRIARPELGEEVIFVSAPFDTARGLPVTFNELFDKAVHLGSDVQGSRAPKPAPHSMTCHGYTGVGTTAALDVLPRGKPLRLRLDACAVVLHERAYLVARVLPEALDARDSPLLEAIENKAELSTAAWRPDEVGAFSREPR